MQEGNTCRNAVNVSVCRFCDFHVAGEYKRLNSSRGPLITATVGARLGAHAKAVGVTQQFSVLAPGPTHEPVTSAVAWPYCRAEKTLLYVHSM